MWEQYAKEKAGQDILTRHVHRNFFLDEKGNLGRKREDQKITLHEFKWEKSWEATEKDHFTREKGKKKPPANWETYGMSYY